MELKVSFAEHSKSFGAKLAEKSTGFQVDFGSVQRVEVPDVPVYTGDYTVTPKVDAQTLATKSKRMTDNVQIKGVPYFETSNDTGTTVFIASEV